MDKKEDRPIFGKALLVVFLFLLLNLGLLVAMFRNSTNAGFSGFAIKTNFYVIKDTISQNYFSMSPKLKIFLAIQWAILVIVLVFALLRDKHIKRIKESTIVLNVKKDLGKNKTELDVLYDVLRDKKELNISTISKSFNITKDKAIEWCKILESGDLATIDYPGFGEPYVRILDKDKSLLEDKKIEALKEVSTIKKEIEKSSNKKVEDKIITIPEKKLLENNLKKEKKKFIKIIKKNKKKK
ncbi:MAG: hypothetical protein WC867_01580 [Candidatus Pacearchaeota archaeon]|jgi:hypothetical protein